MIKEKCVMSIDSADTQDPVIVKKYANRRLYDTNRSSYVTLDDLNNMLQTGASFVVLDAKTGEDITETVLAAISPNPQTQTAKIIPAKPDPKPEPAPTPAKPERDPPPAIARATQTPPKKEQQTQSPAPYVRERIQSEIVRQMQTQFKAAMEIQRQGAKAMEALYESFSALEDLAREIGVDQDLPETARNGQREKMKARLRELEDDIDGLFKN